MNYKNNLFELIGNTPMLRLNRLFKDLNIFAKIERFNPTGSIKDRTAFGIIQHGLQEGLINESTILIEPTSGNTGIALSAIASYLGLQAIIVMPENMSRERVELIEAYGAKVIKTSKEKGMQGAIDYVNEQIKLNNNYFSLYQFASIYNPLIHYNTTAKEIDEALDSKVDVIISGIGTGGTISGVSKYFKERYPNTLIIGVEPSGSPVITKGYKGPHKIQGIGAGFIPEILDVSLIDEFVTITDEEAYIYTKEMVKTEGLLVGISSGAALACAAKFKDRFKNKNVVVILPDAGERYISTGVFNEL